MNPEDQPTVDAPQGAPSVSTDAEYDDAFAKLHGDHKSAQAQIEPAKPADSSFGKKVSDFFSNMVPDSNTLPKYGKAVARGVVNAGREAANTLNAIGEATGSVDTHARERAGFVEHWYNKPIIDSKPMTDGEVEAVLGKRQEGMAGFVESASQFATGMLVAGEVLKPIQFLQKANTVRNALAGGLADMTVFDPYQERLSNLVQKGPFANEFTKMLASDKNDSEIVARLKAGTEGILTGYTLDKIIGGVKALRALKGAKTEAEKAAALENLNVAHNPETQGPAVVKPQEDGTFLVTTEQAADRRVAARRVSGPGRRSTDPNVYGEGASVPRKADAGEIEFYSNRNMTFDEFRQQHPHITTTKAEWDAVVADIKARPVTSLPYGSAAEAESVASSINQAALNRRPPLSIHLLSDTQVQELKDVGNKLLQDSGWDMQGTDINFDYSASTKDAKATIEAISQVMPRNAVVQTHAQTVAQAGELLSNRSGEEVVQLLRDANVAHADMPAWIDAARTYLYSTAEKVVKLSKAADGMPNNPIAFHELKTAMEHLYDVHESAAGLSKTAGRSLDAHKIIVGAENIAPDAIPALEAAGTSEARSQLGSMSKSELLATARLIRMSDADPKEVLELIRGQKVLSQAKEALTGMGKVIDKVNGARMEAMLSGPRTHIVNAVSNAMAAVQMSGEMWWAGVTSGNRALREQGSDQLLGLFLESRDAWRAARKAFSTGVNELDSGAALIRDAGPSASPLNGVAKIAHLPSRMLLTSDEFFKSLNYRTSVRAQSLRLARQEGITDAGKLATRLSEDMNAAFSISGGATNPKALQWARTATFQNPLEYGFGKSWQELVVKHPMMRFITPFVRTPVNISRYAWDRTPGLNLLRHEMRDDLAAGGERAAMAMAKMQTGAAVWTGAALLAHNKLVTGDGPKDPELRAQWLAAGNQPYSVKIPGHGWVSYARANPSFTAVGIVADLFEMSGEMHAHETREIAGAFAAAIASNITNQTFMQGISNTLDALSHGDKNQMLRLFDNTAGSFVPNVLKQTNPDDTLRETRGFVDEIKNRIPGFSTTLEPRRNIFGEKIMKAPGYLNATLNPFTFMADPGDHDVQQELVSLGKAMSMPSEVQGTVKLTDRDAYDNGSHQSPYDRMLQITSQSGMRKEMTDLVKSDAWKNYSDGSEANPGGRKFHEASQIISKFQDRAFAQVLREYPKLKTALHQDKVDKAKSMKSTPSAVQQDAALFQTQ